MSKRRGKRMQAPDAKLSVGDKAYLDGLLSAFEDFSDGAWQAACEAAIAEDPRFKGRDPYEVWLAWCEA